MVYSLFEGVVYMHCGDLLRHPRGNKVGADSSVMVGSISHDVGNSPGKCFDWTVRCLGAMVTDALSPFSILLVGDT